MLISHPCPFLCPLWQIANNYQVDALANKIFPV